MEFNEQIKQFAERVTQMKPNIATEEATKMSMVVPFFQILGYDVFNPAEFCPEFTADVGIKKGEKVDYAIMDESGAPLILIECKWCGNALDKHGSQLFRYFGTSPAKFGILTNGIVYRFYTDLEETNKMDLTPFLEINLSDLKDYQLNELKKFCKSNFDSDKIFSTASELKYTSLIKGVLAKEFDSPSDEFIRFILSDIYDGPKTQKVIEKFQPIVKKSFTGFINDIVNQKISSALSENTPEEPTQAAEPAEIADLNEPKSKIVTTEEEIEAFYVVRGILAGTVDIKDVVHRDTESYFGILYQDNNRKPICRFNFDKKRSQIMIPDENKVFTRYYLDSLDDIYTYKDQLIEAVKRYSE
ncbi:type I restriction endonuclease [Anaerotignum sp.]|uniref:type I restriction endonuclease n=1 Tax=Anaerotignum sp. TaxID=2039241 RepID=UPI002A90B237|nr:type I restriction endonuclease [Anaerotignum sp.]MCI7658426.1 type I restriction endonuclease [Clostridia bacterium]MDY5415630.1 type I restriction endonuclease [Anaerotignum sp.]